MRRVDAAENWVLRQIAAHGPITAAALAARLQLAPARLRALFETLGRRGYVQADRQGVPDLTRSGRHALVALVKADHEKIARPIRGLERAGEQERTGAASTDARAPDL